MYMANQLKTITHGLIPNTGKVESLPAAKAYSDFCEATCTNLFAFSPYQLHLDREEFLHYQFLADELKSMLADEDCPQKDALELCSKLAASYENLMHCCWEAFVCNTNINADPGKFIVVQMMAVEQYEAKYTEISR